MASYSFFGLQVAIKNFYKDPLRQELHRLISSNAHAQTLLQKRAFWKSFTAVLNEAMPVFERGYWDLVRGAKAEAEFETWSSESKAPRRRRRKSWDSRQMKSTASPLTNTTC